MTLSDEMEQALLGYFANDDSNAVQSLTTIFEKINRPSQWGESFFSDIDEIDDKEELRTVLSQMVMDGLLQENWGARDYEGSYRLTDQGIYEASGFSDYVAQPPSNVLLTESGEPLMTEDGQFIELEGPSDGARTEVHQLEAADASTGQPEFSSPTLAIRPQDSSIGHSVTEPEVRFNPATDSSQWTGKQFVLVDAKAIEDLRRMARELQSAVYALRIENNFESSNLKGLADALISICDMAEPETTIIERILASPKFKAYASILGIIATIRGAFNF